MAVSSVNGQTYRTESDRIRAERRLAQEASGESGLSPQQQRMNAAMQPSTGGEIGIGDFMRDQLRDAGMAPQPNPGRGGLGGGAGQQERIQRYAAAPSAPFGQPGMGMPQLGGFGGSFQNGGFGGMGMPFGGMGGGMGRGMPQQMFGMPFGGGMGGGMPQQFGGGMQRQMFGMPFGGGGFGGFQQQGQQMGPPQQGLLGMNPYGGSGAQQPYNPGQGQFGPSNPDGSAMARGRGQQPPQPQQMQQRAYNGPFTANLPQQMLGYNTTPMNQPMNYSLYGS